MQLVSRPATEADLDVLVGLYRMLEDEMTPLSDMWPLVDGLAEPIRERFVEALEDEHVLVRVGQIDAVPFAFALGRVEPMLPQASGRRIGAIRLIFVDPEAREVGLAEVMRDDLIGEFVRRGISRFDAHVLPGHRLAKNFFEAGGFSARAIVMHRSDET